METVPFVGQARRLAALAAYDILDTGPEAPFDDLAALVAAICDTPVALVSLVEERRQWFKAHHGVALTETPIGQSICAHTIQGAEILEIEDTRQDPRTSGNPLCNGTNACRFYAGAPLRTPDGLALGSLCVLDYRPRKLTDLQRRTLRVLADQVMAQLSLRLALQTADTLRREIDHRVKNALQSLMALTRLEARGTTDDTRAALERVSRRIDSVAVVHELLFQGAAGQGVALDAFLDRLAGHLAQVAPAGVTVTGTAEPVTVAPRDAVMVGTLLNEAAANAFKHAFPGGRSGHVTYSAARRPGGLIRIDCADDGIGLPDGMDLDAAGLGTLLGEVISVELDGTLQVRRLDLGTLIRMEFRPSRGQDGQELDLERVKGIEPSS